MDKTVPAGAALLLDFIGDREAPGGYNVIYGNNQTKLDRPITLMTVDQVLAAQPGWSKRFGSSATGRYQFMQATLAGLKTELKLLGTQIFSADLQDRLGYHLLKRRGYDSYMVDGIDRTEFGKRLAMEWASLPVLAACKGAHAQLKRGQSYYAGDALNKALIDPASVEHCLDDVKLARTDPQTIVRTVPDTGPEKPEDAAPGVAAGATATAAVAAAGGALYAYWDSIVHFFTGWF